MTTSKHLYAGALIALVIEQPVIALPLAFLSHFVLDAVPHYGHEGEGYGDVFKHRLTFVMEGINLFGVPLLLYLLLGQPWWVWASAIVALSPDFAWVYRYFWFERKGLKPPAGPVTRFHLAIQRYEVEWGIIVEYIVFGLLAWTLVAVLI